MKVSGKTMGIFLFALTLLPVSLWAGTVSGTVTNARTNQTVANAKVKISGGPYQDSAFTDILGQYSLFNVPAGNYTMIATAPLFNSIIRTGVTVTTNPLTQDFDLQVTATVRGTVTNSANGYPVSRAQVVLTLPISGSFVPETLFTDAQGMYLFDSVSNSNGFTYRITVTATGFQTAVNNTVIITDARRAGIADFSLVPIGVAGTGSVTGVVASANSGALIAGAQIIISRGGFTPETTTTNAQGQYRFDSIPAQNGYTIDASAATYNNSNPVNLNIIDSQTTVVDLNLQSNLGTVWGQVLQVNTTIPIANALVRIFDHNGILLDSARSDAQGYYDIFNVPPAGGYTMIVTAPLYNSAIRTGITVPTGYSNQNFNLQVTATIRGTVSNSVNGNPVVGAQVVLTLPSNGSFVPETLSTDAQGMYLFDSVSNGNNYLITVTATGFQTATNNTVTITDARRSGIADFSMIPGSIGGTTGSVSGTVASANSGLPLVGALVTITGGGIAPQTTYTDSLGHYQFVAVDTAQSGYTVTASAATFNNAVRNNVGVLLGQTTVVDLNPNSSAGILPSRSVSGGWKTYWISGRLTVEFPASSRARSVEVFDVNGALHHRISVPPGATRAEMPADISRTELLLIR